MANRLGQSVAVPNANDLTPESGGDMLILAASNPDFAIAGVLCCVAAVMSALGRNVIMAMMFVSVGMMFVVLSTSSS